MNFLDKVIVNPSISLRRGQVYPFVEMANVGLYSRDPQKVDRKSFSSGAKFADGDTVVARITPCLQNGKAFYCRNIGEGFGSTEFIVFRPKDETLDHRYLYYLMQTNFIRERMIKSMVGATGRQRVNNDVFKSIDIRLPHLRIQKKIADILYSYDDLIENNRKQIKLLEEAARRLYKEWFIDLRFPGHEHTKISNGVPEGWKVYPFSAKVSIMSGGTPKTDNSNYYGGKIPFYTPKDRTDSFFSFKAITNITEEGLTNCNSRLYPENTVVITARGTVGKTTLLAVPMAINQSCYALKSDEIAAPYYLFFALNKEIAALKAMSNGGVFNAIIVKTFNSIHISIPSNSLIPTFEASVRPIMEQIKVKTRENFVLSEARDRLLPKLMSEEVEV